MGDAETRAPRPTTAAGGDHVTRDERRAAILRLLSGSGPPMPVVDDWVEMKRIAREGYYDE